ncbi:DEAD/DEAH box helicase, partial [bacterium]|nr:DEAD/DEAH box helicase [bacterium]
MKFTELNILPVLESALEKENIVDPTPIQIRSSRAIFDGRDSYISSETGTGKTLAYLLPLLTKLNVDTKELQVIVLTPTHELASQVQDQLLRIKENSDFDFRSQLLIGSASMKRQLERLKKKPHIVIGSIGRILELTKKRKLKVHTVKTLVIDEADKILMSESLSMIDKITRSLVRDCQKIFVSATNQRRSNSIADEMSNEMVEVHSNSNQVIGNIEHIYFNVHE